LWKAVRKDKKFTSQQINYHFKILVMKRKYIDTLTLLAALSGGGKRRTKRAA
jgi:hypothetical protein